MVVVSQFNMLRKRKTEQQWGDAPTILAFAAKYRETAKFLNIKSATENDRVLLSDRRGWLDHLTPPMILKSVSFYKSAH
jgi:hypothetical protein